MDRRELLQTGLSCLAVTGAEQALCLVSDELARWTPIIKATNFKLD